jgi:BirA family biotin operon repressor/biotin-[acetyl-CoA-carboxylase] ligase
VSPFGANLYLSVIWGFDSGAAALEGLSLAVGVAIARALSAMGVAGVGLKWPNDVYWQGRKLGGILLEMVGDAAGHCQVVVGVGINVNMPRQAVPEIDQPWCDLSAICGQKVSRNQLAGLVLSHLLPMLSEFERNGFAAVRAEWSSLDCIAGKPVVLHMGERMLFGTAAGVGDTGALAIDTDTGRQWFHGGEVSLRLQ